MSPTRALSRFWVALVGIVAGTGAAIAGVATVEVLELNYFASANDWRIAIPYVAAVPVAVGFNLLVLRLLRCPHCGRRFNWKNFRRDPGAPDDNLVGMPERLCPGCGKDVCKAPAASG